MDYIISLTLKSNFGTVYSKKVNTGALKLKIIQNGGYSSASAYPDVFKDINLNNLWTGKFIDLNAVENNKFERLLNSNYSEQDVEADKKYEMIDDDEQDEEKTKK